MVSGSGVGEEVTRNFCHASMRHLFDACKGFIERIDAHPQESIPRLWPRFELDAEFEKFVGIKVNSH